MVQPPPEPLYSATSYRMSTLPAVTVTEELPAPPAGLPSTIRYAASWPEGDTTKFGTLTEAAALPSFFIRDRSWVPLVASPIGPDGGVEQWPKEKQGVNWLSVMYTSPGISWRVSVNGPVLGIIRIPKAVE